MKTLPHLLLKNWWVIVCVLMAWSLYLQAIHKKNHLVVKLEEKVYRLSRGCAEAESEKEELLLRMQSQDDPEWMELVLKEKLGVVPEGQIKVVFQ
ncbi:MAG: hypothetical protein K1060chlam2_01417 [Chlamydiae bacterium]|nr:hypothetical protein [Chlamydiota bacterium]